jgi:hydrogenase maturation protease
VTRVTIAGIGNVLMGDDGIGPYVARVLEAQYDFEGAQVCDLGTPVLDFADHLDGSETIVIIDAVENDKAPGSITLYSKDDMLQNGVPVRTDPHSPALSEMMLRAEFTGIGPKDAILIGITAKSCEYYEPITAEVKQAVPAAIEKVLREVENLGVCHTRKQTPSKPNIWWDEFPNALSAYSVSPPRTP